MQQPARGGVTGFVEGDDFLLVGGDDLVFLFQSADDAVDGVEEVLLVDEFLVLAGGHQRGFVAHVGDVGARETWGLLGEELAVDVVAELQPSHVHLENLFTAHDVGQLNVNLAVETAGTEQGLVEDVGAVGGFMKLICVTAQFRVR